jgi:hypothetical protein
VGVYLLTRPEAKQTQCITVVQKEDLATLVLPQSALTIGRTPLGQMPTLPGKILLEQARA